MSPATLQLALFLVFCLPTTVFGKRKREGCYDAAPFSCDTPRANPLDLDFSLEEVCAWLEMEVFRSEAVAFNVSLHEEYLNSIDANSDMCTQAQLAYSQCLFCADVDVQIKCFEAGAVLPCGGGLPTRAEILLKNDDDAYARFHTGLDIDNTCADLEAISSRPFPFHLPTTIDLCERQNVVKHLCPGVCDGTCFDPEINPPSCDPNAYQGPFNESLDNFAICDEMRYVAFYKADIDVVLNVSAHSEYLRAIQDNSTFCQDARQAYNHCSWCAEELCFNEEHPATCQVPQSANGSSLEGIDTNAVCHDIYWAMYDITFPDDLYNTSTHTGRILMPENTTICNESRQVYHKCYWCAPDVPVDFCLFGTACSSNVTIPHDFVSYHVQSLNATNGNPAQHCDRIFDQWNSSLDSHYPFDMQTCYEHIYLARLCPQQFCPAAEAPEQLDQSYLGATTRAEKLALIWMSRSAAFLSFFGAIYILIDILTDRKARQTTYHSLLTGMAVFDIMTAAAWCLATAPIPKDQAPHILGANGTEATCTAQAFFVQLGFSSVLYNVSLSLYYVLVIAFDWREFQLRKIRLLMHAFPVTIGLGLAVAAIPYYHWLEYGCHLLPPPEGEFWVVVAFVILPLGLSIILISESMFVVYFRVRQRASVAKKWAFGDSKTGQLEKAVFWQCLFYVLAFFITWPILFAVYLASVDVNGPLPLTLTVAFVAPLQGFTNFLVYMRPKVFKFKPKPNNQLRSSIWKKVFRFSQSFDSATFRASETDRQDDSLRGMDPSAALALRRNATIGSPIGIPSRIAEEEKEEEMEEGPPRRYYFKDEQEYGVPAFDPMKYDEGEGDLSATQLSSEPSFDTDASVAAEGELGSTQLSSEADEESSGDSDASGDDDDCFIPIPSCSMEPMLDVWSDEGVPKTDPTPSTFAPVSAFHSHSSSWPVAAMPDVWSDEGAPSTECPSIPHPPSLEEDPNAIMNAIASSCVSGGDLAMSHCPSEENTAPKRPRTERSSSSAKRGMDAIDLALFFENPSEQLEVEGGELC